MLALVTGGNRGIGLELCRQLAARGDQVIATCRRSSPELDRLGVEVVNGIDVRERASIASLAEQVAHRPLDLLINNAGILSHESLDSMDAKAIDRIEDQFHVNALGPLLVTQALLANLHEGSKVAILTSRMGSIADNTSGGAYGYRMSKAAVNAAGVSLARDLAARGVAVCILHPGYVRTDMTGGRGLIDADESAAGVLQRIDGLTLETTGSFWHANGEELPW